MNKATSSIPQQQHFTVRTLSKRVKLIFLLVALIPLGFLWPVARNDFVRYDDPDYVTENPHILGGLNKASVLWAFRSSDAGNWHPLTWVSHMLDVQLFGTKPAGHHVHSLLLHVGNTFLLALLLWKLTGSTWRSSLVALLFALHPLHVESVAWVAERKDVLSTFYFLLTLIAYSAYSYRSKDAVKMTEQSRWLCYLLAIIFFALGLMSKSMLVTTPFLLLLMDFWPLQRLTFKSAKSFLQELPWVQIRKLILEKLPFFSLAAICSWLTYQVQKNAGAVSSIEASPLEFRISNAIVSYARYLEKIIWPKSLAVFYPAPHAWPAEVVFGCGVLLLLLTAAALFYLRQKPYLAFGWFWFIGTLVPVIGIIQVGQQAMADRYSYIPSIGLFVSLVWLSYALLTPLTRAKSIIASSSACLLVVAAGLLSFKQLSYWRDNITLFTHALEVTGENAIAHNNLGVSLLDGGKTREAERHFAEALRMKPNYPEALVNLALFREREDQPEEATRLFQRALAAMPTAAAHYNFANLLAQQGKLLEAEEHYHAAIHAKPEFVEAIYNLANTEAKLGKIAEALAGYHAALTMKPDYTAARLTLGALLANQKMWDEAISQFQVLLNKEPSNPDIYFNLANVFSAKGDLPRAADYYSNAFKLRPDDNEVLQGLALSLLSQGKFTESVPLFRNLVASRPNAQTHYFLALALDGAGQKVDALAGYREAVKLKPDNAAFLNDLAWFLATNPDPTLRSPQEAIALAEKASMLAQGKEPRFLGTLDAAYASAGRFTEAVQTAEAAKNQALAAGQQEVARAADERLSLYRERKPYYTP